MHPPSVLHRMDLNSFSRLKVAIFMSLWFVFSVASLFVAKHVLHIYHLNEAVFTLCQFALSVLFGLTFTVVLRMHRLTKLSSSQLRAIIPLSLTFLVKEILKYAALSRVSVNLVNTIRSLGPMFNVLIEFVFLGHRPQQSLLWALLPIILGVALTSIDEMHVASASNSLLVTVVGFAAAILSTAINNGQNVYSKILFGRERIDPVSLQIYLSAISLFFMSPFTFGQLIYQAWQSGHVWHSFLIPSWPILLGLVVAGFVNFIASQLAFNTLQLVSPLTYSVANTFKRVAIAVIAIFYFSERLSVINGVGIAVSIMGIFVYERKARVLRELKHYRRVEGEGSTPRTPSAMPKRKQNASGPDLVALAGFAKSPTAFVGKGDAHSNEPMHRQLLVDVALMTTPTSSHLRHSASPPPDVTMMRP